MVKKKLLVLLVSLGIFFLAAFFRFYGLNWDQNQHLHPDERFLTMVVGTTSWPQDLWEYLDATTSPLNPHNRGYGFFVYGTFPLFFTKWIAEFFNKGDYNNLTIVGRQLSAVFDLGTVFLVFLIGKAIKTPPRWPKGTPRMVEESRKSKISLLSRIMRDPAEAGDNWIIGLFAAFFYAAMVLPIQLSHFFAVDTYLTFFITLSFYLLIKIINHPSKILTTLLGISFGLALASKISALLFLPVIGLGLLISLIKNRNIFSFFVICCLLSVVCYLTFRLAQPYVFATGNIFDITLNQKVLDNWKQLKSFDGPDTGFPPALQWIPTKPYIYPLVHNILWGLGLPLGLIAVLAIGYQLSVISYQLVKKKFRFSLITYHLPLILILLWIFILFLYQGIQFAKAFRYFYPIYPFLAIISSYFITQVFNKFRISLLTLLVLLILLLIYPFSFLSIYTRPHSRIQASEWIYKNIPSGATLANEYWDDPQPLYIAGGDPSVYKGIMLSIHDPDTIEKWIKIAKELQQTDYIFLTSNRLWRSLSALPEKYPFTSKYYRLLFDGSLGFDEVAVISSYPCLIPKVTPDINNPHVEKTRLLPPPVSFTATTYCNLALNDDGAEESFTVYDHPKVIIFKNMGRLSQEQLFAKIIGENNVTKK